MTAEWDDLARLAQAATPGPWRAALLGGVSHEDGSSSHRGGIYPGTASGPPPLFLTYSIDKRDAEFIAAANPATILRLIEQLRLRDLRLLLLESGRDDLRSELEQVRSYADMWRSTAVENEAARDAALARLAAVEARIANAHAFLDAEDAASEAKGRQVWSIETGLVRAALAAPTNTTKEN